MPELPTRKDKGARSKPSSASRAKLPKASDAKPKRQRQQASSPPEQNPRPPQREPQFPYSPEQHSELAQQLLELASSEPDPQERQRLQVLAAENAFHALGGNRQDGSEA